MSTEFSDRPPFEGRKKKKPDQGTPRDLLTRLPPQNLEAERGVLGSILFLNDALDDVADVITADFFYSDANQRIYAAITEIYEKGKKVDAVTLAEDLDRKGELEEIGGPLYVAKLLEDVPHAAHAKYYAEIVREKYVQRSLIYACTDILKDCYESADETEDILQRAEQSIFRILEQQESANKIAIKDILIATFDRLNERMNMEGTTGLATGFKDLDEQTTGFQPTELIILAARPSMGKTAFVCNLALNSAMINQKGILLFSLEQSNLELAERFLCIHAEINGHDMRQGDLDEEQRAKLMQACSELSDLPLFIDDAPGRTMPQINAIARRLKRHDNLGMVIIDYLQLVEPEDKRQPREQQISTISRRLKHLAKECNVPVIALSQLNRGVELREDKRPRLADLRESGAIEQDADLVMFLHRPDAYDPEDRPGEAEVVVAKHRSGPTGIVTLTWRKEFMRFDNFSHLNEPDSGYFASEGDGEF